MRYTKFTVAVAAAGAGVICLAPAAAAEETASEPGAVAVPGARDSIRGIIPCVRVGVPVVPEGRIVDATPPDPVRAGDGSVVPAS